MIGCGHKLSIFTSLSGSNIRMNYGYSSYLVEIVIFLSNAVDRQHSKDPADLCISFSLLFPNIRHIYTTNMICVYIIVNTIFPCTPNKNDIFSQFGLRVDKSNNPYISTRHLNFMILYLITAHICTCKHAKLFKCICIGY